MSASFPDHPPSKTRSQFVMRRSSVQNAGAQFLHESRKAGGSQPLVPDL